jgi:Bacterial Ig domain
VQCRRTKDEGDDVAKDRNEGYPAFNLARLSIWCLLTLSGAAAIVWVSWFTSTGAMRWPVRLAWWVGVLALLWLAARRARRFLDDQGWSTDEAPPSEHALRGAALIGGIVLSTAVLGSTAGREMVLSAADAVAVFEIVLPESATTDTVPAVASVTPVTPVLVTPVTATAGETAEPVTVAAAPPVPAVPDSTLAAPAPSAPGAAITRPDDVATAPGQAVTIAVLANDDARFLASSLSIVVAPFGSAVVNVDGTITVTLDPSASGPQSLVYRACTEDASCMNAVVRIAIVVP